MRTTTPITVAAAGYRSIERALDDHEAVWAAHGSGTFHHTSVAVVRQSDEGKFRIERYDNTARFLTWGDALLGGALFVFLPRVSLRMLPAVELDGRGAMIRHFHRNIGPDDLVTASMLLDDSPAGLVVVVVNREKDDVVRLLAGAEQLYATELPWGDLEEELRQDLVRPRTELVLLPT